MGRGSKREYYKSMNSSNLRGQRSVDDVFWMAILGIGQRIKDGWCQANMHCRLWGVSRGDSTFLDPAQPKWLIEYPDVTQECGAV